MTKKHKSELNQPVWAIVASDPRHPIRSHSTTYTKAQKRMKKLASLGATGLAIVTNEVAERIDRELRANAATTKTV